MLHVQVELYMCTGASFNVTNAGGNLRWYVMSSTFLHSHSLHCYVINVFVHREMLVGSRAVLPILRTRDTPLSSVTKQKVSDRFQVLPQIYSIGVIPKLCFNHSECHTISLPKPHVISFVGVLELSN